MTTARYSAQDGEVIDTSVAGVVQFFLSMTRDRRVVDYLLAMDAQDDWAVDREETASRDPVVQSALHLLTSITQHTQYFTQAMTMQFLALLGSLTTSRSIYLYRRACLKNPQFVVQVEQSLLQRGDVTEADAVLVSTTLRRMETLNKADLLSTIYNDERQRKIFKILQEQSL